MNQNESLNYFQKYYDLATPSIQHQVISFIRPFFPLEEQQQLKNLSPLYKQLIGMITFLIVRQEIIIEELQKQNLEHHRFKQLLELVHYYHELKKHKDSHLDKVLDKIADKPSAKSVINELNESLRALLNFRFKLDTFHVNYQQSVTTGIDTYATKHGLKYDSNNPELANLYDLAKEWHETPAPSIEQLHKLKIDLPIPSPESGISEEERAKITAEVQEAINIRDLQGLGIRMVPKARAIFQNTDGSHISRAQAVEITNVFLNAAQKGKCQQAINDYANEFGLTISNPEKLQRMFEKLNSVGAELKTIESVKSPAPSSLFPAPPSSKPDDINDKSEQKKLSNWPPRLTPEIDPTKRG